MTCLHSQVRAVQCMACLHNHIMLPPSWCRLEIKMTEATPITPSEDITALKYGNYTV